MPYHRHVKTPVFERCVAEQAEAIWRAWRTYGIIASARHVLNAHGFAEPEKKTAAERYGFSEDVDPRRPGTSRVWRPDAFPLFGVDEPLPAGKAYLQATKPLLTYIGGPDSHFTRKDHLYFSGAQVRKALIVVNDWDDPVQIEAEWQLLEPGRGALLNGQLKGSVLPGRRALTQFTIEFDAPDVKTRADYVLEVRAKANLPGTLTDRFAITVFPKHKTPKLSFPGTIWRLNISDYGTHETKHFFQNRDNEAFLKAAGISSRLLCTMDVTNRYGKDPAATRLMDNIFRYMTSAPPPDPSKSGLDILEPDAKRVVAAKNVFRAAKPKGKDGWGITRGELFFRESIYKNNWITRELPDAKVPVFVSAGNDRGAAGLPLVIRFQSEKDRYALTLDESLFTTGWMKRKVRWLKAALIVNQGGSLPDGPGLAHHGRLLDLYPVPWVENFVHPYTSDLW